MSHDTRASAQLYERLVELSGGLDDDREAWPAEQFRLLAEHGVLGWVVPREFGGGEVSASELIAGYQRLAATCLTTTFVLTQRNGACQRIADSANQRVREALLPALAGGELFATVGVSHLTTSRQHLKTPAVKVAESTDGFVFEGEIPWVTGAKFADFIVTGGTLEDGRQVLAAVPTDQSGVVVNPPPRLLALNASQTTSVKLSEVAVSGELIIDGPVETVMQRGKGGGAGSLTTSALAVGAALGSLNRLHDEVQRRADLAETWQALAGERETLSAAIDAAAQGAASEDWTTESIRQRANSLVSRAAQAYLAASKGAGFVAGHPAERAVREAMFFFVWSCPQPVLAATLRELACGL